MQEQIPRKSIWPRVALVSLCLFLFLAIGLLGHLNAAPYAYPLGSFFHIDQGESLRSVARRLEETGYIGNSWLLSLAVRVRGLDRSLIPGDYVFTKRLGTLGIATRITRGDFGVDRAKVTIPEGSTVKEVSDILQRQLPAFSARSFVAVAQSKEGYLFPDTYFFTQFDSEESILSRMRDNFDVQIAPYKIAIASSGYSLPDIITLASLVEKEGNDDESRALIAGILRKRLSLGIPLQVDAVFGYILGKTSDQLTQADLQIDSPYNTYRYKGLPEGPIANPGLAAIRAVLFPKESPYLYYLADKHGKTYYAVDLEGHRLNRAKHLN